MAIKLAGLERQFQRALAAIRAPLERKAREVSGTIESITDYDASGRALRASVRSGSAVYSVYVAGLAGAAPGAGVVMLDRGVAGAPDIVHVRLSSPGIGAGSVHPGGFLSSTDIDTILSEIYFEGTTALVRAYFLLWQIPEQSDHQFIQYEVEIRRSSDTNPFANMVSPPRELILSELNGDMDADDITLQWVALTNPPSPPPTTDFPERYGVVQIDQEKIRYVSRFDSGALHVLSTLTRAYDGTTAAAHTDGAPVWGVNTVVLIDALAPNVLYEVRARAIDQLDGRRSNWTNWIGFTTTYDTTPPDWIAAPITPVLTSNESEFYLTWPPADENTADLSHYDVQVSIDGSAWGADGNTHLHATTSISAYDAGNGTHFTYPAPPSAERHFRVRAVDTSGNASDWSNSVRGTLGSGLISSNVLTNPSFEADLNGWTVVVNGGPAVYHRWERITSAARLGVASALFQIGNVDITEQGNLTIVADDTLDVVRGDLVRARCFIKHSNPLDAGNEELALYLVVHDSGGSTLAHVRRPVPPSAAFEWIEVVMEMDITQVGADHVELYLYANAPSSPYSGRPIAGYLDAVELYNVTDRPSGILSDPLVSDLLTATTATANILAKTGAGGTLDASFIDNVAALANLSDVTAKTGSGTTAVMQDQPTINAEAWAGVTLLNSWVNFGSPYAAPAYFKDPFGCVQLRGAVKSGTVGAAIFTLPAGYRPSSVHSQPVDANGAYGELQIATSGNVVLVAGSNARVSLANVRFKL